MPVPNFPDKFSLEPVMRPADTIAMRRRFGKFPMVEPPEGLILCLKNDLPTQLRWKIPIQKAGRVMGDFYLLKSTRGRVGVLSNFGIGAPVVVSLAEEMIAWGVKRFVLLSWGGALQTSLNTADIVITDKALRDDGVSHHYLPDEPFVHADSVLLDRLKAQLSAQAIPFSVGPAWTTDAPYRETRDEILKYQADGVQVVEMEIAGLLALAQARNVQAAAIVVVADKLASLHWEMPADMKSINRSFELAYRSAINALDVIP